jgi:peptidyl-prolyl cis-trans isomerase SurA
MNNLVMTAILFGVVLVTGCTKHHTETLVARVGDQSITLQEYEDTFARLNGGWDRGAEATIQEREEFLDLLVKFRLKIQDAYASGLHREPEVRQELEEYRRALASAFLLERELVEPALQEMYQRRAEEVRASHILIRMPQNPTPEDTMLAYRKAMDTIQKLETGEPFENVALRVSEDPGVQNMKGDLYYFSGGTMVRPFEDAVYNMNVGEITKKPVRTQFGYHIIKLTDRIPATGGIRVSHIMKFARTGEPPEDTLRAYNEIHAIMDSLQQGADFESLAREYSEDRPSAERGGDLGLVQRRSLPPSFEEIAFRMEPGEISDVVRTEFGFHIIKVSERQPIQSYEEMKDNLRRQYQNNMMRTDQQKYVEALREKYTVERFPENVEVFALSVDSTWYTDTTAWPDSLEAQVTALPLFRIDGKEFTAGSVANHLYTNPEFLGRRMTPSQVREFVRRIEDNELIAIEAMNLQNRYPEYARQIDEYHDGILIYYIEQKRIWEAMDLSDEVLLEYYEQEKDRYRFPDRVNLCEIVVRTDSLANALYERILAGEDMEELAREHTMRAGMKQQGGVTGLVEVERDELSRHAFRQEVGEVSEPFPFMNRYAIVKTLEKDPARIKTFDEARGQVMSEYQDIMAKRQEEEWLENLRSRYSVETYPEILQQAFVREDE